jgi:hypothetical protein
MPTAYLSPSQLQDLTNVSSTAPVSGDNGKALVWNQAAGRWQAEQVAYSNLSGAPALPIPVGSGGTGTQTGSITGTGALTFAAGGTNQNVNINPSGPGGLITSICPGIQISQPANTDTNIRGIRIEKTGTDGFFEAINGSSGPASFTPYFFGRSTSAGGSLIFFALQAQAQNSPSGTVGFAVGNYFGNNRINNAHQAFGFFNYDLTLLMIDGNGDTGFYSTTESTSTTNGAVRIAGGVGIAKNLFVGGDRINFANLPTSEPATVGDLWRDGNVIKVKI